jgi:UDP-3-O-[3-hydroxymyristoyl] glucosamine N-acyltransferase
MAATLAELALLVGGKVHGDENLLITGVAPLSDAGEGEISFFANPRYGEEARKTRASAIIAGAPIESSRASFLLSDNPYLAFAKILAFFRPPSRPAAAGISEEAHLEENVRIGEGASIFPGVFIGRGTTIGERTVVYPNTVIGERCAIGRDCIFYPNVTIREETVIGDRVILQPGAVIGSDGFGFAKDGVAYVKIPQVGVVILEDDVEVGANTTIDRATLGTTVLRKGVKIDNLVQIAHGIEIGENSVLAAQVGIAGSTRVGRRVSIGGQAGITGHIEISDDAVIGGQAGVTSDVPPGSFYTGYPARPYRQALRSLAELKRLPGLRDEITALEKKLSELERKLGEEK